MVLEAELDAQAMEPFIAQGLITEVVSLIRMGKEATAYLCRAHRSLGRRYAVAKVYHERDRLNFKRAEAYREGTVILNGQVRRAMAKGTAFGQQAAAALWVDREFDALSVLYDAGTDVPEPIACEGAVLLLEYVGTDDRPAPQLQQVRLDAGEATRVFERLLWNVERWLAADYVHGDLSAYNILYDGRRAVVIDLPQAVDPRFAPASRKLLERDLANVGAYFRRYGIAFDAPAAAEDLWGRWKEGALR